MALIVLAFASLGFLIGNLVGLSAESTLKIILPLLFTFGGGSAAAFIPKLEPADRRVVAAAVVALSLSCLAGVYSGIVVCERHLLSPAATPLVAGVPTTGATPASVAQDSIADRKYLRSVDMRTVDVIDQKFRTGAFNSQQGENAQQAYEQLYGLVTKGENP